MPERSRAEPWATQMEALAAFMGWEEERWEPDKVDGIPRYQWFDGELWPDASGPWNPFTDARADYALLERVRVVWARGNANRGRFEDELTLDSLDYEVGDYARAVLESLEAVEEE